MTKIGYLVDDKHNDDQAKAKKKTKKGPIDYQTIYNRFEELTLTENEEIS
jgi:hypothetical protein